MKNFVIRRNQKWIEGKKFFACTRAAAAWNECKKKRRRGRRKILTLRDFNLKAHKKCFFKKRQNQAEEELKSMNLKPNIQRNSEHANVSQIKTQRGEEKKLNNTIMKIESDRVSESERKIKGLSQLTALTLINAEWERIF